MQLLHDPSIWLVMSFLLFVGILWKFGRSALISMLDSRIRTIQENLSTAENLRVEAQEMLAQYQRKHRDAVKDAESIIATAEKQAEDIRKKAEADLDEAIARKEKQLKERLERLEQNAKEEIRRYAANLAIEATTQIILENIDKDSDKRLVDQSLKDLSANLH
ncbi:MAG: hypothetical protein IT559_05630 [Alphaproteobacteria bacterium]|nr:hypothetical protein [Alphaproteobacteria bacterium]